MSENGGLKAPQPSPPLKKSQVCMHGNPPNHVLELTSLRQRETLNDRAGGLRVPMQICNHPLITYPPDGYDSTMLRNWATPDERLVSQCGKMQFLDRLMVKFARTGHRVLLFSTMTKVLDLMESYFTWRTVDGALQTHPTSSCASDSSGFEHRQSRGLSGLL
jgi:hypothetical protein